MANVGVGEASVRDHGAQFIGNTTITTFYQGAREDDKRQRRWKDVISWLSPSDEALKLQSIIENESRTNRKLDKTGLWFIENEHFRNWIEGRSRRIWVNGAMGCGKTVLFLLAVEEVQKICRSDKQKRLAYSYCTSRSPLGQDLPTLFRSVLRQLCSLESIPIAIQTLYERCDRGIDRRSPSTHELASCLKEVVSHSNDSDPDNKSSTEFFLLVDGLDELAIPTMDEFLNHLKPIVSRRSQNLHVLLVSRNHKEIEFAIDDAALWDKLPLDIVCVQKDIEQFVLSEIASTTLLRRLPQDIQAGIIERVAKQSFGMFRWAFLQMQSLKALKPPVRARKVQEKLRSLPKTLDATYDEMLQSLDKCDQPLAWTALRWLAFSRRPLYLEELIDALAIDLKAIQIINDRLDPLEMEALLKDFIQVHPPLLPGQEQIPHQVHRVVLAHGSIKEYLLNVRKVTINSDPTERPFRLKSTESDIILAQSCLAYLLCFNTYELRHRRREFPLLRYAWYHWEQHFPGPDSQYVQTISTAEPRREASKIFVLVKNHIEKTSYCSETHFDPESSDLHYLPSLRTIINGVRSAAQRYFLDIKNLPEALNVPYFYPAYDEFYPSGLVKKAFLYDCLESVTSIRLLETLPAIDPATQVICRLIPCRIEDAPPYAALSYFWGPDVTSASILIGGQTMQVQPSSFTVLHTMRLRIEDENPAVWMDSICINQEDTNEWQSQASLMPMIYRQAREVFNFGHLSFPGTVEQASK